MKKLDIFKKGKHTTAAGQTIAFSEDDLQASVSAYDPKLHEAPIVIGHPSDGAPAYGWIGSMEYAEGNIEANPIQVDPEFAEMVVAGRFKKISSSFYHPDSPVNPVPGVYYLRHVGFLGAQAPAIKGLRDASFSESAEDYVEFTEGYATASIFRNLRDFFIEKFGLDTADSVLPGWLVESVEDRSKTPAAEDTADNFNEEDKTMTPEQIAALEAREAQLKKDQLEFQEKQDKAKADAVSFSEDQAKQKAATNKVRADADVKALIEGNHITPAHAAGLSDFVQTLDDDVEIEFSEGEGDDKKAVKKSPRAYFVDLLKTSKTGINFAEQSADDGNDLGKQTNEQVAQLAKAHKNTMASKGVELSFTEAVAAVHKGEHLTVES